VRTTRKLALATALTALFAASASQAAFIFVDTSAPIGSASTPVPAINNFQSQLSSNGVSSFFLGRSLSVAGAQFGDYIEIDFMAAEAGYRNQLIWGSTTVVNNLGNQSWSARDRGNVTAVNGVQNFRFCSVNPSHCLTNAANDTTVIGSFQSIGMYLTNGGNTAWLLWDDSGANMDDNHDDLIVRLTYHSVPEPGTLTLLGLGLVGVALIRRRKISQI